MSRTSTAHPQGSPADEPDVVELAFALGQRITGEVPITPVDRETQRPTARCLMNPRPPSSVLDLGHSQIDLSLDGRTGLLPLA